MASHLISINKLKQKQVNRFKITLRMLFITIKHLVKLNLTVCLVDLFTWRYVVCNTTWTVIMIHVNVNTTQPLRWQAIRGLITDFLLSFMSTEIIFVVFKNMCVLTQPSISLKFNYIKKKKKNTFLSGLSLLHSQKLFLSLLIRQSISILYVHMTNALPQTCT